MNNEWRSRTNSEYSGDKWSKVGQPHTSWIDEYRRTTKPSVSSTDTGSKAVTHKVGKHRDESEVMFEKNVTEVADLIAKTVIRKQRDYGPNNIRKSPFGEHIGLVVRLYDKLSRLANLTSSGKAPENESIRDTYLDIAGYGIIGLMILDGTFPKE